jgi:hypothetical protein
MSTPITPTPVVPPVTAAPPTPPPAPPVPTPGQSIAQVQADIASDTTAVKGALVYVAAQARSEYDSLSEAAKGRFHTLLNDLEHAGADGKAIVLAGMHSLFGEKPPTVTPSGSQPTAPSATVTATMSAHK